MRSEAITWIGGEHEFALTLPLLEALQQRNDGDGVGLIYNRIVGGVYKVNDIIATVALGLEGGGMAKMDAVKLARNTYEDHGLNAMVITAQVVLALALNGFPEDESSGEAPGEAPENP